LPCLTALLAAFALGASGLNAPARAQAGTGKVAQALDATFREWMRQHDVDTGSLAAMKDGVIVKSFGYGGLRPGQPARVASLSKAITAVCIARLVDDGRLSFTTPLATVLANTFRRFGNPVDPRFKTVTIEQLLMHRAGFAREPRPGPRAHDIAGMYYKALATPLASDPGREMSYSNIGYLTLGVVVEAVTGSDYERYCRGAALAPMKAAASIDPQLRDRAPNGGWRVSAADYAKFLQVFEPDAGVLGPVSRKWLESRNERPAYGLGIYLRRTANGFVFSHAGKSNADEGSGSYALKFDNGWTAVVTFEGDVRRAGGDLHRRLEAAVSRI